jgi:hypothetical protein
VRPISRALQDRTASALRHSPGGSSPKKVRVISCKKEALPTLSIPKNSARNALTFRPKKINESIECGGKTLVNQRIRPRQFGVACCGRPKGSKLLDGVPAFLRRKAQLEILPSVHGLGSQPILFLKWTFLWLSRQSTFDHSRLTPSVCQENSRLVRRREALRTTSTPRFAVSQAIRKIPGYVSLQQARGSYRKSRFAGMTSL